MLLVCCRLQELEIRSFGITDIGLLEGIGSLQELTSLHLIGSFDFTTEKLTEFLHRPSMSSMVLLNLSGCFNLDDKGLEGIAKRCNNLTYLHV